MGRKHLNVEKGKQGFQRTRDGETTVPTPDQTPTATFLAEPETTSMYEGNATIVKRFEEIIKLRAQENAPEKKHEIDQQAIQNLAKEYDEGNEKDFNRWLQEKVVRDGDTDSGTHWDGALKYAATDEGSTRIQQMLKDQNTPKDAITPLEALLAEANANRDYLLELREFEIVQKQTLALEDPIANHERLREAGTTINSEVSPKTQTTRATLINTKVEGGIIVDSTVEGGVVTHHGSLYYDDLEDPNTYENEINKSAVINCESASVKLNNANVFESKITRSTVSHSTLHKTVVLRATLNNVTGAHGQINNSEVLDTQISGGAVRWAKVYGCVLSETPIIEDATAKGSTIKDKAEIGGSGTYIIDSSVSGQAKVMYATVREAEVSGSAYVHGGYVKGVKLDAGYYGPRAVITKQRHVKIVKHNGACITEYPTGKRFKGKAYGVQEYNPTTNMWENKEYRRKSDRNG